MHKRLSAVLAVLLLALPVAAYATNLSIQGEFYNTAAQGKGIYNDPEGPDTWFWDGDTTLTLDGYDGGGMTGITGDFNVVLSGENKIDGDYQSGSGYGLRGYEADVTISGDGSLDITSTGQEYSHTGIRSEKSLTIENTEVNVSVGDSGAAAIFAYEDIVIDGADVSARKDDQRSMNQNAIYSYGGDIIIRNGSNVDATVTRTQDSHLVSGAIRSFSTNLGGGHVLIEDSTVNAIAEGPAFEGSYLSGIMVQAGQGDPTVGSITIRNSTVHARGIDMAVYAEGGLTEDVRATISIEGDSTIVSPENGTIQDTLLFGRDNNGGYYYGQTIGTGAAQIESLDDGSLVRDVLIQVPAPEPDNDKIEELDPEPKTEPVPTPAPAPAAPATVLPKTADATLVAEAALSASGGLLALATLIRRRRRG